ncbi:MAG: serine hydrolase domain-containing protein [Acidobacteriota bacterium]
MLKNLLVGLGIAGALAVLGLVLAARSAAAPPFEVEPRATEAERLQSFDLWLAELHQDNKFNGGVLIAREGEPLLMKSYGFADASAERPLAEDSAFRLASVSKQFTATAILLLVQDQALRLDVPVATYLEGFPYPDVTITHLLQQTSGIPDVYLTRAEKEKEHLGDVLRVQDVPKLLIEDPPEPFAAPGAVYAYSNTNYVTLAALVEVASGLSFEEFTTQRIFQPLGMKDSRVWNLVSEVPFPNRVRDFQQRGRKRKPLDPTWIDGVAGDGAVHTSLRDLLRWDAFWRQDDDSPRILSPELLAAAQEPPTLTDGSSSTYAFGLEVLEDRIEHSGGWLGARTYFARYPADGTCIAILDNSASETTGAVLAAARKALRGPEAGS